MRWYWLVHLIIEGSSSIFADGAFNCIFIEILNPKHSKKAIMFIVAYIDTNSTPH